MPQNPKNIKENKSKIWFKMIIIINNFSLKNGLFIIQIIIKKNIFIKKLTSLGVNMNSTHKT